MGAALGDAGVGPGDRVAVCVHKSPEALLLYLACLRTGAVFLPLNPAHTEPEVGHVLADAAPELAVVDPARLRAFRAAGVAVETLDGGGGGSFPAAVADRAGPDVTAGSGATAHRPAPGDPAVLLYTSGTTGRPKGAMLSHANLASNAATLRRAWGFEPADRLLHALPTYHAHGLLVALNVALAAGSSMWWLDRFEVGAVLDGLSRCTVFMGVPTHYTRLLADSRLDCFRCAGARLFVSGSAPLAAATHLEWEERTGHRILERYGMTETVMIASNPLEGERRPGTVGPPLPGVDLRVVDPETEAPLPVGAVGGVEVRGPSVFAGYWRRPDLDRTEFAEGGWFRTGDLGSLDSDGYLRLAGRAKDLIISGGLNVYPKEVEDVIDALAGVKESAVVGVPDPDLGETVVAVVVTTGARIDPEALRRATRGSLAGYKVPKAVHFVDALPRNAMGKVDKGEIRRALPTAGGTDLS